MRERAGGQTSMRALVPALPAIAALACGALFAPGVEAQAGGEEAQVGGDLILGAGGGVTFYCLDTRCDSGTTLLASLGYAPTPHVVIVGSGRWHGCFDCDRFLMVEASLHVRHPGPTWQPYAAAGLGMMSDPEFIGTRFGGHVGAGTWWWPSPSWGLQADVRGRHVGRGDGIIEVSLAVAHRRF